MLLPAQVLPFLQHEDAFVRSLSARYFVLAHDPAPATADDAWRSIDRFQNGQPVQEFIDLLATLPHTEASIKRTMQAIEAHKSEPRGGLERVVSKISYGTFMRYRDVVEGSGAISDELRSDIRERIALADAGAEELWEKLKADAAKSIKDSKANFEHALRLIEALTRHPQSAGWAISALNAPDDETFLDMYSAELLGQLRHTPAAEMLAEEFLADSGDMMTETLTDALIRIGGTKVVQMMFDRFSKMGFGLRLYATDIIAGAKLPQSENALLTLLDRTTSQTLKTKIATGLCELAATETRALEKLRETINSGDWDITLTDLDADVLALFIMTGQWVPEMEQWRMAASNEAGRTQARMQAHRQMMRGKSQPAEAGEAEFAPTPGGGIATDTKTYRRETPKVGRNDPCICGSGKKYKKCCGR
jgi:hypothetical protein